MEEDSVPQEDTVYNITIEENNDLETENCLPANTTPERIICDDNRPGKRTRELDDEEIWIEVGRNGKRINQKIDMYVNSSEILPKQFAFAKLLKANNIEDICRVKYINPYKVFIQFECVDSADKLINCKPLQELGWRCQKPLEVVVSYGVIKNVELSLSEKDMLDVISSNYELLAVKRLKRRNKDSNGWEECESVRLAFKGPTRPAWVYIYGMKINVEPYIFPVTQCSRCWRFGHSLRSCPKKKIVCPKCGKDHANCESTIFKCVNCTGNHMSLERSCPAFKKEKRIRELMAEYNCSYRKALQVYVPPEPPVISMKEPTTFFNATDQGKPKSSDIAPQNRNSYAQVARTVSCPPDTHAQKSIDPVNQPVKENNTKKKGKRKKQRDKEILDWDMSSRSESGLNDGFAESENETHSKQERTEKQEKQERRERFRQNINLREMLYKLYTILCNSQDDLKTRLCQAGVLFIEWLTPIVGKYIWELPFQDIFNK